jgi:hypothetical protein
MAGGYMRFIASVVLLALAALPLPAKAWNIPGHMLSEGFVEGKDQI